MKLLTATAILALATPAFAQIVPPQSESTRLKVPDSSVCNATSGPSTCSITADAVVQPMHSGDVHLNLTLSGNVPCDTDGLLGLDTDPADPPQPTIYSGTMTGVFGTHGAVLDLYTDQGLLDQPDEGCQNAVAMICTSPGDPLNLNLETTISLCAASAADSSRFDLTGSTDLALVDDNAVADAWGALTGTIDGDRLDLKLKAVVTPSD